MQESGNKVSLPVRSAFTGKLLCEITVTPLVSVVRDLKVTIELSTAIPAKQQLLTASGSPLLDEDRIGPGILECADAHLTLVRLDAAEAAKQHGRRTAFAHIAAGGWLSQLSQEQRSDPELVLAAVARNVCNLGAAAAELRSDSKMMLTALHIHPLAYCYMDKQLWFDRDFALSALAAHGELLQHAPASVQDDPEVVLCALGHDGHLLKWASPRCRGMHEVVLAAVQQKGTALCHAAQDLKDDRQIVLAAVRQNGMAFCHVGPQLREDREVRSATWLPSGRPLFEEPDIWPVEGDSGV